MSNNIVELDAILGQGPLANVPNPYPLYKKLRDESPVIDISNIGSTGLTDTPHTVMITRYDDVRETLRDDTIYSNDIIQRTMGIVMGPTIIGMDGREHLKHRTIVTPSLATKALHGGEFRKFIEKTAHEIIDRFVENGVADLHKDFCFEYPLAVFVGVLGIPKDEIDKVHNWGIDLCLVASDPERGLIASAALQDYLTPIVQAKRLNPADDMISRLVMAEVDGHKLSDLEVVSFLRLLTLAGAETTNHLLGTAFYAMLQDEKLFTRVRNNRSLIPALLHEAMRWESPVSTAVREAIVDTEIAGVKIPKGTGVLCNIGAANRDERKFKNPDLFDIDRDDNDHIAFGFGRHYCVGSHLAKLEAEVGVNALLDRLADLKIKPNEEFAVTGFAFRGPDRLPVSFKAAETRSIAARTLAMTE